MTRNSKRRWMMVVGGVLAAATLLWFVDWRAVRVRYHDAQMKKAYQEQVENQSVSHDGLGGFEVGEPTARFEYHRDRLVELGTVVHKYYEFRHLRTSTPESSHFNRVLLMEKPVKSIEWTGKYSPAENPVPLSYTVWCYAADASSWDAHFAKHDVPDYKRRFMTE
jgi:hypothetical protein